MGQPAADNPAVSPTEYIGRWKTTQGSEPSQYLQEKKTIVIPKVVANEMGLVQTKIV